jgi:2-oxoglutarate ferredoxin oxidoreductase subunit delta
MDPYGMAVVWRASSRGRPGARKASAPPVHPGTAGRAEALRAPRQRVAPKTGYFVNKIVIDSERCKGCYLCIEACSRHLITVGEQINSGGYYPPCPVTDGQCTACALCAHMCPDAAIEVYREVKEE